MEMTGAQMLKTYRTQRAYYLSSLRQHRQTMRELAVPDFRTGFERDAVRAIRYLLQIARDKLARSLS